MVSPGRDVPRSRSGDLAFLSGEGRLSHGDGGQASRGPRGRAEEQAGILIFKIPTCSSAQRGLARRGIPRRPRLAGLRGFSVGEPDVILSNVISHYVIA